MRRIQIIDAGIRLLAMNGIRGLTHRRIDQALEIPEGSTSVYFRTRAELLAAVAGRVADLDLEDACRQFDAATSAAGEADIRL